MSIGEWRLSLSMYDRVRLAVFLLYGWVRETLLCSEVKP